MGRSNGYKTWVYIYNLCSHQTLELISLHLACYSVYWSLQTWSDDFTFTIINYLGIFVTAASLDSGYGTECASWIHVFRLTYIKTSTKTPGQFLHAWLALSCLQTLTPAKLWLTVWRLELSMALSEDTSLASGLPNRWPFVTCTPTHILTTLTSLRDDSASLLCLGNNSKYQTIEKLTPCSSLIFFGHSFRLSTVYVMFPRHTQEGSTCVGEVDTRDNSAINR